MVKPFSALIAITLLMLVCASSYSLESLRGPTFSNSSSGEVDVAVMSDGKTMQLLHAFPAGQLIAMPDELRVQSVIVVSGRRHYELGEPGYAAESEGLSQRRQLWVFDGSRICVKDLRKIKSKSRISTCQDEKATR